MLSRVGSHLPARAQNGSEERNASPIRDLCCCVDSQNVSTRSFMTQGWMNEAGVNESAGLGRPPLSYRGVSVWLAWKLQGCWRRLSQRQGEAAQAQGVNA